MIIDLKKSKVLSYSTGLEQVTKILGEARHAKKEKN